MKRLILLVAASAMFSSATVGAEEPLTLSGTWYQRIRTTSIAKLPVIGEVTSESRFYAVVRLDENDGSLRMETNPCFVRIEGEVKRVQTIVPEAMTRVMGPKIRTGTIAGSTVRFGRAVDVLGARLQNEWKSPLPDEPDEASVIDEDGDGNPGVTVRISGPIDGKIFVVQRAWNELAGRVAVGGQRIDGNVDWGSEQKVLDATSVFLKSNPPARRAPEENKNTFTMHRAPDGATCHDLSRKYVKLFKED
jgi:hypothetical protein